MFKMMLRRLGLFLASMFRPKLVDKRCKSCVHWDHREGQAALRNSSMFANNVAPHVSPSRMMQRFDVDGNPLVDLKTKIKASEDNWESFGLCGLDENLRHCGDVCSRWTKR